MKKSKPVSGKGKIIFLFSLLALTIFIFSACTLLNRSQGAIQLIEVHKGTAGLEMNFLENTPPPKVYASTKEKESVTESIFPVGIRINNKGASDINSGYLSVSLERDYMSFVDWDISESKAFSIGPSGENIAFELLGKSQIEPLGEDDYITFNAKALEIDPQSETHKSLIVVSACYDYKTESAVETCISPQLFSQEPIERVCIPGITKLTGGQGAPVAVTNIETRMLPGPGDSIRPQFIITVENVGNGEVVNRKSLATACSSLPLALKDWNIVDLRDISFSKYSLAKGNIECSNVPLRLRNKKGEIKCILKENMLSSKEDAFKTTLFIALEYGYTFSKSKDVIIEKID